MQEDETRSEAACIMKRRGGARCRTQEMARKECRLVRKVNYRTEGIDSGARGVGGEPLVPPI